MSFNDQFRPRGTAYNNGTNAPYAPAPQRAPLVNQAEQARYYARQAQFESAQRFGTSSPVVKREVNERISPNPSPYDRNRLEATQVYNPQQVQRQPMAHLQAGSLAPRTGNTARVTNATRPTEGGFFNTASANTNTNAAGCPPTNGLQNYQQNVVGPARNRRHAAITQPQYNPVAAAPNFQFPPNPADWPGHHNMSIYQPQNFTVDYPQNMMHGSDQEQDGMHQRYPSPPPPMNDAQYTHQEMDPAVALNIEMPQLPQKEDSDAPSPGRSKPIPKPDREVMKGEDGRFLCTWPGCTEEVRSFGRKCEWSKHMDKHDRPYKCLAEGCEKLPGFTYSGGLLRHQREVHNLHGGPRKQLNCPHINCKRFAGKGFSRQENLNEHLRRVHTDGGAEMQDVPESESETNERAGMKRKRSSADGGADVRQEVAKLRKENEKLRRQVGEQNLRTDSLLEQVQALQAIVGVHALPQAHQAHQAQQAPQANMSSLQNM